MLQEYRCLANIDTLVFMKNADSIRIERPRTNSRLFAHTRWDAIPALASLFHLAYFLGLFFLYPHAPLWIMLILGFIYSLMVNANINGIGHNFIHNPFFRSTLLNRLFGVTQSIACCFSQTYYDAVHMQHHKGNADRPDENGETIDWISISESGPVFCRAGRNSAEVTRSDDARSASWPFCAAASFIRATIRSTVYSGLVIFAGSFKVFSLRLLPSRSVF